MKKTDLFKICFFLSLCVIFIGTILKLTHTDFAQPILMLALLLSLGYIIIGIMEVQNSKNLDQSEKIMWTIGFIFFGTITGIVYLLVGRKKALQTPR